jgi:hypothetical protein
MKLVSLFSGDPLTVMVYLPVGVLGLVAMERRLLHGGVQGLFVKVAVVPGGRSETVSSTGSAVPDTSVRVMVTLPV